MDAGVYKGLKWAAIILGVTWLIWNLYGSVVRPNLDPSVAAYNRAVRDFKDGHYEKALKKYEETVLHD